jgi:hypothetical protein
MAGGIIFQKPIHVTEQRKGDFFKNFDNDKDALENK